MKRKSGGLNDSVGETLEQTNSPGYTNIINSPLQTPVSTKGGRAYNRSKVSKEGRSGPQTHIIDAGEKIFPLSFMLKC